MGSGGVPWQRAGMAADDDEAELSTVGSGTQPSRARRKRDVVVRRGGPWSFAVLALLRHYEAVGFDGAPRVVEPGLTAEGEELVTFLPGSSPTRVPGRTRPCPRWATCCAAPTTPVPGSSLLTARSGGRGSGVT